MFQKGDIIFNVYDDKKGIVISIIPKKLQDYYVIEWNDGTKTTVPREEIY